MRKIEGAERDKLLLEIINRIDNDTQVVGSPERTKVWEKGWAESLAKFVANPCEESLIPAFIRLKQPVRRFGELWEPTDTDNELTYVRRLQEMIADHFRDIEHIVEFGFGTGFNLLSLAKKFPDKHIAGFDFSQSAVDLIGEINKVFGTRISPHRFDMRNPRADLKPEWMNSPAVFTFGAIEQLAGDFVPLMEYILASKPSMVIHIEPVVELYDETNLLDALAAKFHRKRGYTTGLLPWLQNDPRVSMRHVQRGRLSSLMMDGYSWICWVPK